MENLTSPSIKASCVISGNAVYKNNELLFRQADVELPGFLTAAYHHFDLHYAKFYKMDNLSKLGWLTAEVLLKDTLAGTKYAAERISVILANANSSLDTDLRYLESVKDVASPALFVYTLPNIVIGEICIRHKFKGENAFFIQEYFEAGFIAQTVDNLFDTNLADACICGWVDVIGQEYKAALFLIERNATDGAVNFSGDALYRIFGSYPG
jgi:hypothetical protein